MVLNFRLPFHRHLMEFLSEEWEFVKLTTSYLSTHIARVSMSFVTILFAGTISQAHLDGVGLAMTLYNIFAVSVAAGFSFVFETYGPQVYGPSKSGELTTVLMKCLLQGVMVHLVIISIWSTLSKCYLNLDCILSWPWM